MGSFRKITQITAIASRFGCSGYILCCVTLCFVVTGSAFASDDLNQTGLSLVKQYCYKCHNGSMFFDITDGPGLIEDKYLAVDEQGNVDLDKSQIWARLKKSEMPPEDQPQPTADQKETIGKWLAAGAKRPSRVKRPFVTQADMLSAILNDVMSVRDVDRPYQRYFTLTHLYNNNEQVSEFDLRLYRAALSKAINSLSWEPEIVVPKAIDDPQTIYRVDVRDLGWDKQSLWREIIKQYPYGLTFKNSQDPAIKETYLEIERITGSPLPYVRADWFVVTATRPPLYHTLLGIPATDVELEQILGVDVASDFQRNRISRAGFAESGISTANRLVDRHPARMGKYYWKSYDFKKDNARSNLFQLPLGPEFAGNPHLEFAFAQDGGEQIFGLPNGLQGYMLVDRHGNRIDKGPIDVVRDRNEVSGSPEVFAGISCMACHQHGMRTFKDTVRAGIGVFGDARDKALELFVPQDEMDKLVSADADRFMAALSTTIGPFLQTGDDRSRDLKDFAEPITAVTAIYDRDMPLEMAAFELGVEKPDDLKIAIKVNPELKALGLGPLANGALIQRNQWEDIRDVNSAMQKAARSLDQGEPYRAF